MPYIGKSPHFGVRNRFVYTASGSETSKSGADDSGATLTFTDGAYVDVYLNGVLLKPDTDYVTTTANTIGSLSALSTSDILEVIVYDVFSVSDTVSAASGGTFSGAVTLSGGVSSSLTVANGLTLTDGDVTVASGHGISFAAHANDSEMTSELLDDYEEGLATMAFSTGAGSATINTSYDTLSYTKIGRMVHINGQLAVSSVSSLGTGNTLQITGLPFAAADLTDTGGRAGFFIMHDAADNVTDGREIVGFVNESGSVINVYEQNLNGVSNHAEHLKANTSFYFSFAYNTT